MASLRIQESEIPDLGSKVALITGEHLEHHVCITSPLTTIPLIV